MLLIALSKTLGRVRKMEHGIIFIIVMLNYVLAMFKIRAFNYDRVRMWHIITLICVLWLAILTVVDLNTAEHLAWVVLMFVGWGVFIIAGVIIQ